MPALSGIYGHKKFTMDKYLLLIWDRYDIYNRHWIKCETLERARALAHDYSKDHKYTVEIYPTSKMIEVW